MASEPVSPLALTLTVPAEFVRAYVPVLLAVTSGMRRGEFLALKWADINLTTGVAAIRRSVEQTNDEGIRFKSTKGKKGRPISLLTVTMDALRYHRSAQDQQKKLLGEAYQDNDLICANEDGSIWKPDTFTADFARLAKKAGLKGVRLHDMRHSLATQLLGHGVHPKIVSEKLGHSNVGITLDIYSHVLPGMQEAATLKIDASLRAAIKKRDDLKLT